MSVTVSLYTTPTLRVSAYYCQIQMQCPNVRSVLHLNGMFFLRRLHNNIYYKSATLEILCYRSCHRLVWRTSDYCHLVRSHQCLLVKSTWYIPTISFLAPFPARRALLFLLSHVRLPKYKTAPVPKKATKAAVHARFRTTQSYTLSVTDLGGGRRIAGTLRDPAGSMFGK